MVYRYNLQKCKEKNVFMLITFNRQMKLDSQIFPIGTVGMLQSHSNLVQNGYCLLNPVFLYV